MEVEVGIQNVARPVRFTTDDSADSVAKALKQAVENRTTVEFTDDKKQTIVINGAAVGYAVLGVEAPRHVGFGV